MSPDVIRKSYQNFFIKTEGGQYFINNLVEMIAGLHEKAEDNPELARDYVQRAKGAREIKQHIDSVMAERRQK